MTTSTTATVKQYAGNSSTTVFSIPFTFTDSSEIEVVLITDSTNAITAQSLTTHYTIAASDLTMVGAPATGVTLDIRLAVAYEQDTDLVANSSLPAETLESMVDELSKQVKQLKAVVDLQCIKLPKNILTSTTVATTDIVANQYFRINAAGTGIDTGADAT